MKWLLAALVLLMQTAGAADRATLAIADSGTRLEFSRDQLLARPDVRTIIVTDSVYHGRVTRFKAVPVANLLKGLPIPAGAAIECAGSDGFSALLDAARLLDTDPAAAHAYLAIEEPGRPWPALDGQATSAGPFYVVWTDPQASAIGREEWPFKVVAFTVVADDRSVFPHSLPAADAGPSVATGFKSYRKNCLACHRMNGDGGGSIGPDLNRPSNPVDYLKAGELRALIRDPASVRVWPGMKMRGFPAAILPEGELDDLLAYLEYMSRRDPRQ